MVDGWYCAEEAPRSATWPSDRCLARSTSRGSRQRRRWRRHPIPVDRSARERAPDDEPDGAEAEATAEPEADPYLYDGLWKGEARSGCGDARIEIEIARNGSTGSWVMADDATAIAGDHSVAGRVAETGDHRKGARRGDYDPPRRPALRQRGLGMDADLLPDGTLHGPLDRLTDPLTIPRRGSSAPDEARPLSDYRSHGGLTGRPWRRSTSTSISPALRLSRRRADRRPRGEAWPHRRLAPLPARRGVQDRRQPAGRSADEGALFAPRHVALGALHGIAFNIPDPFPVNTAACRAFYWLADQDPSRAHDLAQTLYRGYFVDNRDLSNPRSWSRPRQASASRAMP